MKSCRECQWFRDYFGGYHDEGYCVKRGMKLKSSLQMELDCISCKDAMQSPLRRKA